MIKTQTQLLPSAAWEWLRAFQQGHGKLLRVVLYVFVILVACPIRYWPFQSDDGAWRFALNYGPAHGLKAGIDTVFTTGPLAHLTFPECVGANLANGLVLQAGLWLLLAAVFADVFFRADFPLRNLSLFTFCFGLSGPMYWFNSVGVENLILAGGLILLVTFRIRGSLVRYLVALVMIGFLPLFKLTAFLIGCGALLGFLGERALEQRRRALQESLLALIIPAFVAAVSLWFVWSVPLFPPALLKYLRGSAEIISGYSYAMSMDGPRIELLWASLAVVAVVLILVFGAAMAPQLRRFFAFLLAVPLFVSFKHGFIRQDNHIINFFCFVAFAVGLISFALNLHGNTVRRIAPMVWLFFMTWLLTVFPEAGSNGPLPVTMLWGAMRPDKLEMLLQSSALAFPKESRIEPELRTLIGNSKVASLSFDYTSLGGAGLQLTILPVVERYSAYTPYLDRLNAAWIRDQGPRFLVFDGSTIDSRNAWAETPALWLEIYRWYDTRALVAHNLLLERRAEPRFTILETTGCLRIPLPGGFRLPNSREPVFWTMKCNHSLRGQIERLFFRVPKVSTWIHESNGDVREQRIIPEVLISPVLGNYIPYTLQQFAQVFNSVVDPSYSVDQITIGGPGSESYSPTCEVALLRPAR